MKRVLCLAAVMCMGFAHGALAADMSVRASQWASPFFLPPVNATPDWSGVYLGFHGGYGFGNSNVTGTFIGPIVAAGESVAFSTAGNPVGAVLGGQIGYNWQAASASYGVEGDFGAATTTGSVNTVTASAGFPALPVAAQASSNLNWLSSVRGRLGYTWGPGLVYITGGGAWASAEVKTLVCDTAFNACTANNFTNIASGWALGAGFEWMMAPNWIARAEYLYYSLGNSTNNVGAFANLTGSGVNVATNSAKLNVIRLGLEYKFDWH